MVPACCYNLTGNLQTWLKLPITCGCVLSLIVFAFYGCILRKHNFRHCRFPHIMNAVQMQIFSREPVYDESGRVLARPEATPVGRNWQQLPKANEIQPFLLPTHFHHGSREFLDDSSGNMEKIGDKYERSGK